MGESAAMVPGLAFTALIVSFLLCLPTGRLRAFSSWITLVLLAYGVFRSYRLEGCCLSLLLYPRVAWSRQFPSVLAGIP